MVLDQIFEPYYMPATHAVPILCDWCDEEVDGTIEIGSVDVCPECFENAKKQWRNR